MTLGQFFLGLVAIFVATVVYRWQKSVDRDTEQKKELRDLYSAYLSKLTAHKLSQPLIGDTSAQKKAVAFKEISEAEVEIYSVRDAIYLLASQEVIDSLMVCDRAFRDWKIAFSCDERTNANVRAAYDALSEAQADLMDVFKADLRNHVRWLFLH